MRDGPWKGIRVACFIKSKAACSVHVCEIDEYKPALDMPCLLEGTNYSADKRRREKSPLGFDDLGGVLVRVDNGNDHDGIGLFYHRPGGCGIFFAAERTLDLSIHPSTGTVPPWVVPVSLACLRRPEPVSSR